MKYARQKQKLTQSEFASILGVTERTVSNWENGKNLPDISLYEEICKTLNITTNELINGESMEKNLELKRLVPSLISVLIIILTFVINSKSIFSFIFVLILLIIILINIKLVFNKKVSLIVVISLFVFLSFVDYLNVLVNNNTPVLKYSVHENYNEFIYKTLVFKVFSCNRYDNEKLYIKSIFENEEEYCTNLNEKEVNSILNRLENMEGAILGIRVFNGEKNDKQYLTTKASGTYELVKGITDKSVMKEITQILKTGKYVKHKNDIGYNYLLQFYTKNETIDFEFNEIHFGKINYNFNLPDESMDKLREYFK